MSEDIREVKTENRRVEEQKHAYKDVDRTLSYLNETISCLGVLTQVNFFIYNNIIYLIITFICQ